MADDDQHYSFSDPERDKPSIRGVMWPVVYPPDISRYLSIQHYLEQSQFFSSEKIRALQFKQLEVLLNHTTRTVPYYASLYKQQGIKPQKKLDEEMWSSLPILKREVLQKQYEQLLSKNIPKKHGKTYTTSTSGSTGTPVKVLKTRLVQFFWNTVKLRDHYWHGRDTDGKKHASIRFVEDKNKSRAPEGSLAKSWGYPLNWLSPPGETALLNIESTITEQLEWLYKQNPHYLLSNPSNLIALAQLYEKDKKEITNLEQLITISETLDPEDREYCERIFNVPIKDIYSSQEIGYLALQCSEHNHYHVQAETVFLEVLNNNNEACKPGEIGRIVVTPLHNFAMPLIRYEIGDYAEVGESCDCGRGLPVLKRIYGRVRNMLTLPSGEKIWPRIRTQYYAEETKADITQAQLIQHSLEEVEVKLVVNKPLNAKQQEKLTKLIQEALGYPFNIRYEFLHSIARSKSGKFEEFISKVE